MFENKDLRPWTKRRHGKLSCHNGICWDMEGMLQVWLITQVDRRYICVSNMVMHAGGNISNNVYVHVILTK